MPKKKLERNFISPYILYGAIFVAIFMIDDVFFVTLIFYHKHDFKCCDKQEIEQEQRHVSMARLRASQTQKETSKEKLSSGVTEHPTLSQCARIKGEEMLHLHCIT